MKEQRPSGARCTYTIKSDDTVYQCTKAASHEGEHGARTGSGAISWFDPPQPSRPEPESGDAEARCELRGGHCIVHDRVAHTRCDWQEAALGAALVQAQADLAAARNESEENKVEWYAAVKSMRQEADRADAAEQREAALQADLAAAQVERDHAGSPGGTCDTKKTQHGETPYCDNWLRSTPATDEPEDKS